MMAEIILRLDAPLMVLLLGLSVYLTREVLVELFDAWDDPAYCPERCRPIQLMALFAAMLWAQVLGRLITLMRRAGALEGFDSAWILDSWMRLGLTGLTAGVAIGLLIWTAIPRWSQWTAAGLCSLLGLSALMAWWPDPILEFALLLYRTLAWLSGETH